MFRNLLVWYRTQDTQQRINVVTSFISDSFRVSMASLLSVFVPQNCDGDICSFTENVTELTDYNLFVLSFNIFTLVVFTSLYFVEIHRERWMISHFDYDKKLDNVHLPSYKDSYPDLFNKLESLNRKYLFAYRMIRIVYILNFIFSAMLIYIFYYLDYRSITVLLTNIMLCWQKISRGIEIATESYKNDLAYSYFNTINLSFNTIDRKFVSKETTV